MSRYNRTFPIITALFITLMLNLALTAQELPVEDLKPTNPSNENVIDTIDQSENLLDSNEVYKKQFDSLSNEGEWVEIEKSEFLQELTESTGQDFDFDDNASTTKIIYVWRPYVVNNYWNPYSNGSWVFTNYGWVWSSYYNWGWAPYNYGRWYCSNYYGWVWFPGSVWAPNYVSWRGYGNYVGWYPTCPQFRWRGRGTHVYTNHLYAYNPQNWVFVNKKDFSKKIDKRVIVKVENNSNLLKDSKKISVATYNDPSMAKFKYIGPDANSLAKESGTRITPQIITAGNNGVKNLKVNNNSATTKTNNSNIKNPVSNQNTKTSNSNTQKQIKESNKVKAPDKNYKKESNNNPVNKNQEKKTEKKSQDVKKESNNDVKNDIKKDSKVKNSNSEKNKSGNKSNTKNKSSTRNKSNRIR